MKSYSLEELARHHTNTGSIACRYIVESDYQQLAAQNTELVAQVEVLRETIYNTIKACNNNSGGEPSLSVYHRALNTAADIWRSTPAQCLENVKANAVFDAANKLKYKSQSGGSRLSVRYVDLLEYAERVKVGTK